MRDDYIGFFAAFAALNAPIVAPVGLYIGPEDLFMLAGMLANDGFGSVRRSAPLSETDKALLELMDRLDLTEEEKIKQLRCLCQECGANINAQERDSVLWKAIEADSPTLVKVVLELGADVRQRPRLLASKSPVLFSAADLHKVNTPKIVEALCLNGADLSEFWKEDLYPPQCGEGNRSSYYDTIKIVLKYSLDLNGSIFDKPFQTFMCFSKYDRDQSIFAVQFEIIRLFMERRANLFFKKDKSDECAALILVRDAIHEKGALAQVCDLLKQIPSIEQRLDLMSRLSALSSSEAASYSQGYYSNSPNILKFTKILNDQILAIKQIRTVSRLLAQGFFQENSTISVLNLDILLEIAANSTQKPKALPEKSAKKIAQTFFARPPTAYTDGCSPLPLALRYEKAHSDGNSPWPIICMDSKPKFGK